MIITPNLDLSPGVLRSFLKVAELRSFTGAAAQLGLQQSTVSQHLRRLEETVGRKLLQRDTHSVSLTSDGDAMLEFARNILDANTRMTRFFSSKTERNRLRLGISEDFALSGLPGVLTEFRRHRPDVDLELSVGLSGALYQRFDAGELDLIFAKRKPGDKRGRVAWREPLVWIGRPGLSIEEGEPIALVAYAPPSITRSMAIEALERSSINWTMSCSSGSLSGLHAALLAGLGVAAHSGRLVPAGLVALPPQNSLPDLPEIEFVAIGPGKGNSIASRMVEMLTEMPSRAARRSA